MQRTRVVIQSRLNSTRLPGKALLQIGGMPLIELVARRARRSGHEVVVATSHEPYDVRIAEHLASSGIAVFRGSLDDVLDRFVAATADLDPDDRVVRLTGDNPVADADLVDELISAVDASDHTYGRVDIDQVPEGLGAELFTVGALRDAGRSATDPYDREHVTPWLRRTLGELLFVPKGCPADVHAYRATVDTLGDFVRVADLFTGEDDPVAVPWLRLMMRLARTVDAAGPRVGASDTAVGRLSRVVMSARHFGSQPEGRGPAEHTSRLRALLASAIERGVTHVDVGRDDPAAETVLRACSEPALTQRFGLVIRLGGPVSERRAGHPLTEDAVEASVERSFAELGRRRAAVLVLPRALSATETDGPAWSRLRRYVDERLVTGLGVVAGRVEDLMWAVRTEQIHYVEVTGEAACDPGIADELAALAARSVAVAVRGGHTGLPSWATSVISEGTDETAFDALARRLAVLTPAGPSPEPRTGPATSTDPAVLR